MLATHLRLTTRVVNSAWYISRSTLVQRYCGSVLGAGWSLMNPIATIGIYCLVFSVFMRLPIPNYFDYLMSGLIPWMFFNSSVMGAAQSLLSRTNVLHCSIVNRLTFIFADTLVELVSCLIAFAVLLVISAAFSMAPQFTWLLLPIAFLPLAIATAALSVIVAYTAAKYRDLSHLLQVTLAVVFWLVPIVYHWSMVPAPYDTLIKYNPISLLIKPIQVVIYLGQVPSLLLMSAALCIAALASVGALCTYRNLNREIIFYV